MKIGLVVNPVAGLGGAVGLKGTDGCDTVAEALRRGAVAQSGLRARRAIARLAARVPGAVVTVVPGPLGADWVAGLDLQVTIAPMPTPTGTAQDTRDAVMALQGCDLLVFAGGDGTARDVAAALAGRAGLLGIPCGVKMHSGVFAISPEAAGAALADLVTDPVGLRWDNTAEIMDIDEDILRAGRLVPRLYGLARVPRLRSHMQAAKGGPRQDAAAALTGAAADIARRMQPGTLYLIGPGTSAGAVAQAAGHRPTLLGTDALLDGGLLARDARSEDLERLAHGRRVQIILGVTGRQGFLLGRGNQTISDRLIAQAGRDGLIVLATAEKLDALAQPMLWVDTGDPALDVRLSGFVQVHTGLRQRRMMRIGAAA
ncbi:MAG: NAD(+)/NADH kinase [Pseudotabrizicola sp.]|uniref:ATP-NAD kinase family protein n=1 Tax=Pseudotabrizicola sp. TaxID=2939647 RepID=UPI0027232025|nr:NAD(+)/NADH kinase [Pseudotabrizicola sp.]MDO9636930.1 NAD(+)/NADH kinase [Pseudotabrizicola sp.]